jgi:hypothetical protein
MKLKNKKLCRSLQTVISLATDEQSCDSKVTYYPTIIKEFETNLDNGLNAKSFLSGAISRRDRVENQGQGEIL